METVSQTDIKCMWASQKHDTKEKYRAVPIQDMACLSNKVVYRESIDTENILKRFIEQIPSSSLAKHNAGRRINIETVELVTEITNYSSIMLNNACQSVLMLELSTTPINFYDDCCKVTYNEIFGTGEVDMYINSIQNTPLWNEERKYRVTGSRIYEMYTYAKKDWEKKSYTYFWPKHFCNKFTMHGIKHEKQAKKVVSKNLALDIKDFGMIVSNSNRWLSYSPDGVIFENGIPIAVLEIKCIFAGRQANIKETLQSVKYLETIDGNLKFKKCHKYHGQVQLGMAILNLNLLFGFIQLL
ncbi:uncharacterized protein LOC108916182 [Anoplophora glabripennis]|uniref:uncharacterized protein LOC108916182 n=1 Tax=Anoplophora glabripennis TaxID=217634 RepID=UPI0008759B87|nr:uncharacterized protein LOC108916182 [Anoplophora glabripennis]